MARGPGKPCGIIPRENHRQVDLTARVEDAAHQRLLGVAALRLGNRRHQPRYGLGSDPARVFEVPTVVQPIAKRHAAHHQCETAIRMSLGIGDRQRRAPGTAEHDPALDPEHGSEYLHVGDQVPRRVLAQFAQGCRAPGSALVEADEAVVVGVKQSPVVRRPGTPGAAMKEDHRHSVAASALLQANGVQVIDRDHAHIEWLDRRVKIGAGHEGLGAVATIQTVGASTDTIS